MVSGTRAADNRGTSVFIADASPFDCQLLSDSLTRDRVHIVGTAVTSAEVTSGITALKPNVAIISVRLQDGALAGLRALRDLTSLQCETRIVMLLDASEPELVVEAFRGGAVGVFSRMHKAAGLRKCIRCVLSGQHWAKDEEFSYVIEALKASPKPHIADAKGIALLTKREEEVVRLVSNGFSNREIAHHLRLSEHTVKNYLFDIFEKTGISTRVELVLYALSNNRRTADHEKNSGNGSSASQSLDVCLKTK